MTILALLREPAFGSLLGILGIIAAAYFFVKSDKRKNLVYVNKESVILGEHSEALTGKLKVSYDGQDVARVTRSVFVIWNAGRETIRGQDIASSDPLRIEFPAGTSVLSGTVDRTTRAAISAKIFWDSSSSEPNIVKVNFEFLDYEDGLNISIIHNAPTGSALVRGTLVGMPMAPKNRGPADTDIEAYRTPKPPKRSLRQILFRLTGLFIKATLLFIPPVVVLGSFFTDLVLAVFPSMGTPDTTAMLVSGKVNWFWLSIGTFFLLFEFLYLMIVFQRPPKTLTG